MGNLTIERCTISGNVATGDLGGGGIYNEGTLVLIDSSVVNNDAGTPNAGGGGILNMNDDFGEYVEIIRTTLSGNYADSYGSALAERGGGDTLLANVTITGNVTNGYGTVSVAAGLRLDIWNSTIAGNFAWGPGGILTEGLVFLSNTILADNDLFNCETIMPGGQIITTGSNIDSGSSCHFIAGPDMPNTDPLLGPLADNGGYTETMALLPGSPAIDAGIICMVGTDQRGVARPIGLGCDIGAYEAPMWLFLPLIMR